MDGHYRVGSVVLEHWKLTHLIGENNFDKVFEAEHIQHGAAHRAAVKIITIAPHRVKTKDRNAEAMGGDERAYFDGLLAKIESDIQLMEQMSGMANIVNYDEHAVVPFTHGVGWDIIIRMEYMRQLKDEIAERHLERHDVIKLGSDMCHALNLCQKFGVVHEDIKPENIFISHVGDYMLGDFGITHEMEAALTGITKKDSHMYMAPEFNRDGMYGPSVDTYSIAMVMYQLLNDNRLPFLPAYPETVSHADREAALAMRLQGAAIPAPKHADPELAKIILKACSYQVGQRYLDPHGMLAALEELPAILEEEPSAKRKRKWPLFLVIGIGAAAAFTVGGMSLAGVFERETPDEYLYAPPSALTPGPSVQTPVSLPDVTADASPGAAEETPAPEIATPLPDGTDPPAETPGDIPEPPDGALTPSPAETPDPPPDPADPLAPRDAVTPDPGSTPKPGDAATPEPSITPQPIDDVPSPAFADAVNRAISLGIVPSSLQSNYSKAITRGEFCVIATATYEDYIGAQIMERKTFDDATDVNIQKMAGLGFVYALKGNRFAPDDPVTKENINMFFSRMLLVLRVPENLMPKVSEDTITRELVIASMMQAHDLAVLHSKQETDMLREYASQVLVLVNIERAKEGIAPLTDNVTLSAAANIRAVEIETKFDHTRPDGRAFYTVADQLGIPYRGMGENLGYNYKTPEAAVEGWMNSPDHRANIMNDKFAQLGVGVHIDGDNKLCWAQLFMA